MQVLVASSSAYRRDVYRQSIQRLGHEVLLADGGVDCVQQMRERPPHVLLLEAPLLWGGSDGVLDVMNGQGSSTRVVLVAAGTGSIDWFQLSRFRVDDVLFRLPTLQELQRAIGHEDSALKRLQNDSDPTTSAGSDDNSAELARK